MNKLNNKVLTQPLKMTGLNWSKSLNLSFISLGGWNSIEDFNKNLIDKNEFLNRASNSSIEKPLNSSRRAAKKAKDFLSNRIED